VGNLDPADLGRRIARDGEDRSAVLCVVCVGSERMDGFVLEQPGGDAGDPLSPEAVNALA